MLRVVLLSTPVRVAALAYGLVRRLRLLLAGFCGGVLVSVVAAVTVPNLFGTIDAWCEGYDLLSGTGGYSSREPR
jgi:uncharacterized membrane protein YkgB